MAVDGGGVDGASSEYLVVGTIRRPHGIRGELLIAVETDRPNAVFRAGRTLLLGDDAGRPTGGSLTLGRVRPVKDGMLLQVVGLTTRNAEVEALRGRSLLIPADQAAPAGSDEVHYRDLRGMSIVVAGSEVGTVRQVMETAGPELLVVARPGRGEALIPFVKEWVRSIDHEGRRIEIEPPEGLLDL